VQDQPGSVVQSVHPSPLVGLASSQAWPTSTTPSPHGTGGGPELTVDTEEDEESAATEDDCTVLRDEEPTTELEGSAAEDGISADELAVMAEEAPTDEDGAICWDDDGVEPLEEVVPLVVVSAGAQETSQATADSAQPDRRTHFIVSRCRFFKVTPCALRSALITGADSGGAPRRFKGSSVADDAIRKSDGGRAHAKCPGA